MGNRRSSSQPNLQITVTKSRVFRNGIVNGNCLIDKLQNRSNRTQPTWFGMHNMYKMVGVQRTILIRAVYWNRTNANNQKSGSHPTRHSIYIQQFNLDGEHPGTGSPCGDVTRPMHNSIICSICWTIKCAPKLVPDCESSGEQDSHGAAWTNQCKTNPADPIPISNKHAPNLH